MDIIPIIIGVTALIVGLILGKIIFAKNTTQKVQEAEIQAQKIISEGQLKAETFKKEKELEKWFIKNSTTFFVQVDDEYKNCEPIKAILKSPSN